jgi:hypothetical protein
MVYKKTRIVAGENWARCAMFVAAVGLLGCAGDTKDTGDTDDTDIPVDTGDPPDPAVVELAGTCDLDEKYGAFVVEVYEEYSIVDGSVANGVVPITILTATGSEGDCTLLRRDNPFCDPPCAPDETCDFDGSCIKYPINQDIGIVEVKGLNDEVVMEPLQPGNSYFDTSLSHPAVDPGNLVTLVTGGGAYDPLRLYGAGVEMLTIEDAQWVVYADQPMTVNWSPPVGDVVRSEIHLRFNIDQHGATPVSMFCIFEDDGQGDVPAALLSDLLSAGVSGFPNGELTRRTVDRDAVGAGCLEFEVSAPRTATVRVDGFIPCDDPTDCPPGQDCNLEIGLCE